MDVAAFRRPVSGEDSKGVAELLVGEAAFAGDDDMRPLHGGVITDHGEKVFCIAGQPPRCFTIHPTVSRDSGWMPQCP